MRPSRLVQVSFRFPRATEVRYLQRPPEPGERVTSARGRPWVVARVQRTGYETYDAVCEEITPPRRGVRDLVSDLFARAGGAHRTERRARSR